MRVNTDRFHPERKIGGFSFRDGTLAFYLQVNALIPENCVLLDVGCGRAAFVGTTSSTQIRLRDFKQRCDRVIGIDVDDVAAGNPTLTEFRLITDVNRWPVQEDSVDVIVADWVMEHVSDPGAFFREAYRVLKKGGMVCIRTSNQYHYAYIGSRLIPNSWHKAVLKKVQPVRKEEDSFPTFYRCNNRRAAMLAMRAAGFEPVVALFDPEPAYLAFSTVTYWIGLQLSRFTPYSLQSTLMGFGKKV